MTIWWNGYDILIDNELRHVVADKFGISTIFYGPYNPGYNGYQTDDWNKMTKIIDEILNKKTKVLYLDSLGITEK